MKLLAISAFLAFFTTCTPLYKTEKAEGIKHEKQEDIISKRAVSRQVSQSDSIYVVTSGEISNTVKVQIKFDVRGRNFIPLSFINYETYHKKEKAGKVFLLINGLELDESTKPFLEALEVKDSLHRLLIRGKLINIGAAYFSFFPFESSIVSLLFTDKSHLEPGLQLASSRRYMDYEVVQENQTTLKGMYHKWKLENEPSYLLLQNQSSYYSWTDFDSTLTKYLANQREKYWKEAMMTLGSDAPLPKRNIHFYKDHEAKALKFKNDQPLHSTEDNYYCLFDKDFPKEILRHVLEADLQEVFKERVFAKGLSISILKEYFGHRPSYWYQKLKAADLLFKSPEVMVKTIPQMQSPLIADLNAGFYVSFLLKSGLHLQSISPHLFKDKNLQKDWSQSLQSLGNADKKKQQRLPFQKGFNFAHEGYQIYNGFGSTLAKASLQELQNVNGNAIAIVPYTFMRNPTVPVQLQIPKRAGGETDGAVVNNIKQAKALGLMTTMKPQIWLSGGSWPGDIEMKSSEEADLFFHHYGNWIKHYALMSQIHDVDLLCVGVEMVKTTTQYPEKWKKLFREIRSLYDGPLVYASNWGYEFENISFWEELDYIGLNCYYPLSDEEKLDARKLRKNLTSRIDMIEGIVSKTDMPLLLTEVGFRSTRSPWVQPHAQSKEKTVNESNQAFCYQLFFDEMENRDWFAGWFWWKWPSYPNYRSNNPQSFAPSSETKKVIRKAFR